MQPSPSAGSTGSDKSDLFDRQTASAIAGFYLAVAIPGYVMGLEPASLTLLASLFLGGALAVLSAIDLRTSRLPDILTLPLMAAGFLFAVGLNWEPPLVWRLVGAAGGYGFIWLLRAGYFAIRGRDGIGMGDAKLLAAGGAWLGPDGVAPALLYGCLGALILVAWRWISGRPLAQDDVLSFGPFMAAGIWLVWVYGPLV